MPIVRVEFIVNLWDDDSDEKLLQLTAEQQSKLEQAFFEAVDAVSLTSYICDNIVSRLPVSTTVGLGSIEVQNDE